MRTQQVRIQETQPRKRKLPMTAGIVNKHPCLLTFPADCNGGGVVRLTGQATRSARLTWILASHALQVRECNAQNHQYTNVKPYQKSIIRA
jgi:hypothetical protein